MNKKERLKAIRDNWYKYHIPGQSNIHRLKRNAIFISAANSLKHEMKKLELCYGLKKEGIPYLTEAERNKKKGEPIRRIDIVNLVTGDELEIERDRKVYKEGSITFYLDDLKSCPYCNIEFQTSGDKRRKYCSVSCSNKGTKIGTHYSEESKRKMSEQRKGDKNSNWKGGVKISHGYIMIYEPNHPCANNGQYVSLHRLIIEEKIGRYLKPQEIVHHINGNKKDNRIENLKMMSQSEHASIKRK